MEHSNSKITSIPELLVQYDHHLLRVRGLADNSRALHRHVVSRLLSFCFPNGQVTWSGLRFRDCVAFLKKEFARLSHRETQKAWLMVLRSILRYLAREGCITGGWEAALPKLPTYRLASLPKRLSERQLRDLENACLGNKPRHRRYRALLLLSLRLGLRVGEIASLQLQDIDWRSGCLRIRSTKNHRERILPLPDDVGQALAAHLRTTRPRSTRVFEPLRPPFSAQRVRLHVLNSLKYLFGLAGISGHGTHSLRHTAAATMVSGGASFKAVADVLGHKSISTTLIYAKLDLKALAQVALPWPGGAQ
jgi:site-specific recombinase XerD